MYYQRLRSIIVTTLFFAIAHHANAALIGHWAFDETTGGTAADSINGNDGIWQNGVDTNLTWTTGQIGGSASLIGNDADHFDTSGITQLNGATAMSLSTWFRVAAYTANDGVISSRSVTDGSGTGQYYGINTNGSQVADARASGEATPGTTDVTTGEWFHVVGVWDGNAGATGTKSVYVNGVLEGTSALSAAAVAITNNPVFSFGDDDCCGTRAFVGQIDDFGIFDNALTAAEIGAIYAKGLAGKSLIEAIPEPSTALLLSVGLIGMVARRRRNSKVAAASAVLAASLTLSESSAQAYVFNLYTEDFSGFSTGNMGGQFGWTNSIGDGADINGAGQVAGDGTDGASRNESLFTLPAGTQSVTVEMVMRSRLPAGSFQTLAAIQSSGGDDEIQFGASSAGYRVRRDDGSDFFDSNIGGDDTLTSGHQFFDHRLSYDFANDSGLWEVSRQVGSGGDGLFTTITSFTSADIGADLADPANWAGIALRLVSVSDRFDDLSVSASVIPEPSSALLLGLGIIGFAARRRKR